MSTKCVRCGVTDACENSPYCEDCLGGRECSLSGESDCSRFQPVSDLPEWTVHDTETGRDLFPTKSGNRDYCSGNCTAATAARIAYCLNMVELMESLEGRGLDPVKCIAGAKRIVREGLAKMRANNRICPPRTGSKHKAGAGRGVNKESEVRDGQCGNKAPKKNDTEW